MKLALLLPGYIESPDYRHLVVIDNKLVEMGFTTHRIDVCGLWETGDGNNYSTTGYINQVKQIIDSYLPQKPAEIVLIGHSLGALVALHIGNLYSEVSKIVCLSLPDSLDKSDHKWVDGFRVSKKDLPQDSTEFRTFSVPFSFTEDRKQYSISKSLVENQKPLLVISGLDDPSFAGVESMVKDLPYSSFIKIAGMGHDFRQSEDLCNQVALEIEKFTSA